MWRTSRSVTGSVVAGFAACLVAVGLVLAWATVVAFDQGRERAESALVAAAHGHAADFGTLLGSAVPILEDLAADPGVRSFDSERCQQSLAPLASVSEQARIVLVDAAGDTVCSLSGSAGDQPPLPQGIFGGALDGDLVLTTEAFLDDLTGHPSIAAALPVTGLEGRSGAVAAVLFTNRPALELGLVSDPSTVVVAVDTETDLVLATTEGAPYVSGERVRWDRPPRVGPDGLGRIWQQVAVPETNWAVYAGLDEDAAFADALEQRRALLWMGAAILGLVIVLAFALQRRLARPIRRVGAAITASRAGDEAVRAPVEGPKEIAEVAHAFNELVGEHQHLTRRLRRLARHDPLTGLLNRRGATEELVRLMAQEDAQPLALLFIDLDRFKLVNDSLGHSVGDELLKALAQRLSSSVPAEWIVSRFGGDEFLIICPATADPLPRVRALGDVLRSNITVGPHDLRVGGSTGVATARPGQSADDLIREADTAMYRAKERGAGGYATFDDEMRAWTTARLTTERDLRRAVERDELVLHYQPVLDLATGSVTGVEALVRWLHPELGLQLPATFIPVAEETGLIVEIGEWVLREAARAAASWRREGSPMRISVNVAAAQLLRGDLAAVVESSLVEAGATPHDLVVEVTETAMLTDLDSTVRQLHAVRAVGVGVSLDDFGTGFSSLAHLQRLPADELKIDRSFVSAIGRDPVSAAIVRCVLELADAIGLEVVAEGVETVDQLDQVRSYGCKRGQGYLFGRPVPASALDLSRRSFESLAPV
jgi:diguanylate cyclase (GGDEF)-like protein